MNILIATPSYYPICGGSEALTRTLSSRLNEIGVHTDIMTLNMDKKWYPKWKEKVENEGKARILREPGFNPFIGVPNLFYPLFRTNILPWPGFIGKLKEYDVIHFIGEADLGFPLFSFCVNKPKILHCVGLFRSCGIHDYYTFRHPILCTIFKSFFPNLANLYLVSTTEEKQLLSDLGVPTEKISILSIGVDVDTFHPDERKKLDNLLLFVGRIDRIKGLHILLEALSYLENPSSLAIIGPKWDAKYAEQVEQMSNKINAESTHKVKILAPMDRSDLIPWYQRATIVICPYLFEAYSNTTREALACGTPVVSTGKHIVESGCDGILISPKDPKKLAGAITRLLQDRQMRKEYGRQGRKVIEENFSWEPIVKDLAELYMDMFTVSRETEAPV